MGLMGHIMTHSASADISQRLTDIRQSLADAAETNAKNPPTLIAVSKMQPDERIAHILDSGQRTFGENRVQEAQTRWTERRDMYADLTLHLIGPLQTNKAEAALEIFDVIETLDRPKLAQALAKAQAKTGRTPIVLIQVNTGEEPQKGGVLPADLPELVSQAKDLGLNIQGLMCIPPIAEPAGPHFALLAKLAAVHGLTQLSMGMSADFETAVGFGATHVRVGSALFGERLDQHSASANQSERMSS